MNWEILGIFMMMVGEMQRADGGLHRLREEAQAFGAPIGSNQYVAGKIVDQKIGMENSRKHLYDTARAVRQGPQRDDRDLDGEADHQRGEPAVRAVGRADLRRPRLHEASTASRRSLRDAVGAPIYSGTNEMQRVRIASMFGL